MAVSDANADSHAGPSDEMPPRYCKGSWRQQLIVLGATAAIVLGFALNLRFGASPTATAPGRLVAAWMGGADPTPGPAAATPVAAVAIEGQRVGTELRTDFNQAALAIRPSTLAVRASNVTDAAGRPATRIGSAVVVDASGYAITCEHVISGARSIEVRRFGEPQAWLPAAAVASEGDLALLKVTDAAPFVPAAFADSAQVRVGDWVLAAGHPFQLGLTVTAGIVSRRDTALTLPGGRSYSGLFQIDAAINEGSSGGPLVNLQGEVVGINTAIYAPTGVFSGAGFAIPANRVRAFVANHLGAPPSVRAAGGSWGVALLDMSPGLAVQLAYPGTQGVVIDSVAPASAAQVAALERGDVIVAIAGQPVRDLQTVRQIREQHLADPSVAIEIWRRGVRRVVMLQLGTG